MWAIPWRVFKMLVGSKDSLTREMRVNSAKTWYPRRVNTGDKANLRQKQSVRGWISALPEGYSLVAIWFLEVWKTTPELVLPEAKAKQIDIFFRVFAYRGSGMNRHLLTWFVFVLLFHCVITVGHVKWNGHVNYSVFRPSHLFNISYIMKPVKVQQTGKKCLLWLFEAQGHSKYLPSTLLKI